MMLTKDDYSNLRKLLESVEIKGATAAQYIAVLAHKLEGRVATWFDGHETGFDVVNSQIVDKRVQDSLSEKLQKFIDSYDRPIEVCALPDTPAEVIVLNRD